jgi:small GTP-binding protein
MEIPKYEYSFKIILLGETAVGKTSFCKQYIDQLFNPLFKTTIGIEYGYKFIDINSERKIKLHIWDTAGQEIYRSITKSYYRDSAGVLLLYEKNNFYWRYTREIFLERSSFWRLY